MNLLIIIIAGIFLLLTTLFDLYHKKVLAIIPSIAILFLLIVNYDNTTALVFGLICGVTGLIFYEISFFEGLADIKSLIILGLLINSIQQYFITMLIICISAIIWMIFLKIAFDYKNDDEIPFMPVIFIGYLYILTDYIEHII